MRGSTFQRPRGSAALLMRRISWPDIARQRTTLSPTHRRGSRMPTLMASAMMEARLAKVASPPAPPPAAQYAADEPAKHSPPKPAPPTPAIVQSPPPITAEAAARRRARYERQEELFRQLRRHPPALFATNPPAPTAI